MKFFISILLFLCLCFSCFSQDESSKKHAVYFELGGTGGVGSINYERTFYSTPKRELNCRFGFSYLPIDRNNGTALIFPLMINYLVGTSPHKLELGLGQGITLTTKGSYFLLTTVAFGYRFQPQDKRWFFRATYTPLISYIVDFQVQQWGGLSIGYRF